MIPGHRSIPSCADTAVLYHNPWLIRMRESTSNPHEMVSTCKTIWQSPASLFLSANISRPELACEWMESTHRCAPTLKSEFVSPTVTLSVSVQRTPLPLNAVLCASSDGLAEYIAVTFLSEMVPQRTSVSEAVYISQSSSPVTRFQELDNVLALQRLTPLLQTIHCRISRAHWSSHAEAAVEYTDVSKMRRSIRLVGGLGLRRVYFSQMLCSEVAYWILAFSEQARSFLARFPEHPIMRCLLRSTLHSASRDSTG